MLQIPSVHGYSSLWAQVWLTKLAKLVFPVAGGQRPVQHIAGQPATAPEEDLPFVLDDDAVAPAYEERLLEQDAADLASSQHGGAGQGQAVRPCYGHRSPATAQAGNTALGKEYEM